MNLIPSPRSRGRSHLASALAACLIALAAGCGRPTAAVESPGEVAPRVFAVAERLEREGKTRQAFAAYRQVVQQFPNSPEARQATDRLLRSQRTAIRKRQ